MGESGRGRRAESLNRCRPEPALALTPPLAKTAAAGVQIVAQPHHRWGGFPAQPQAVLSKLQSWRNTSFRKGFKREKNIPVCDIQGASGARAWV